MALGATVAIPVASRTVHASSVRNLFDRFGVDGGCVLGKERT